MRTKYFIIILFIALGVSSCSSKKERYVTISSGDTQGFVDTETREIYFFQGYDNNGVPVLKKIKMDKVTE